MAASGICGEVPSLTASASTQGAERCWPGTAHDPRPSGGTVVPGYGGRRRLVLVGSFRSVFAGGAGGQKVKGPEGLILVAKQELDLLNKKKLTQEEYLRLTQRVAEVAQRALEKNKDNAKAVQQIQSDAVAATRMLQEAFSSQFTSGGGGGGAPPATTGGGGGGEAQAPRAMPGARGMTPLDDIIMKLGIMPSVTEQAVDASVTVLDRLAAAYEQVGNVVASVINSMGELLSANFEEMKGFAVAEAIINTAIGVTKALGQGGWLGIAGAVAVAAAGAAQIKQILEAKPGSGGSSAPTGIAQSGPAPVRSGPQVTRLALSGGDSGTAINIKGELVAKGTDLMMVMRENTRIEEGAGV